MSVHARKSYARLCVDKDDENRGGGEGKRDGRLIPEKLSANEIRRRRIHTHTHSEPFSFSPEIRRADTILYKTGRFYIKTRGGFVAV